MSAVWLETLVLPATTGVRFVDAWSGQPIADGLRCTLYRRRDGRVLAREATTPSGVHHWPELTAQWSTAAPPAVARAEVLVEDLHGRFLPLRLVWPPPSDQASLQLATVTLVSAPQRPIPPGGAGIYGLLVVDATDRPAAWARVLATDEHGRSTPGGCDAGGRLSLHLTFPRPERRPQSSLAGGAAPGSAEAPPGPGASVTLHVFHDTGVGLAALHTATVLNPSGVSRGNSGVSPGATVAHPAQGAPLLSAWLVQPEVRALARSDANDAVGPVRLEPGRLAVVRTQCQRPRCSDLRLAPL